MTSAPTSQRLPQTEMPLAQRLSKYKTNMFSLFQTATGSLHIPSILMATSWFIGSLVTGGFMLANLRVNRDDRIKASAKEMAAKAAAEEAAKRIADAEANLTKAQTDLVGANERVTKLELKQQPRTVTPDNRAKFIERAKALPKGKVSVNSFFGADPGTLQYAATIREMLVSSGFDCGVMVGMSLGSALPYGAGIAIKSEEKQPPLAGPLQALFRDCGVPLDGILKPDLQEDEVSIVIGLKPE